MRLDAEFSKVTELVDAFQGMLEWKWDARFETALAEFDVQDKDKILAILERFLISRWDPSNIQDAPESVRKTVERLGGMMAGQFLLLSSLDSGTALFCAWWPWGNGLKISIRLAPLAAETLAEPAMSSRIAEFKNCFQI